MKKVIVSLLFLIMLCFLANNTILASDNVFVGVETATEVDDLAFIAEDATGLGIYKDGDITVDELNLNLIQKIYIDTSDYLFENENITAESLEDLINNSNYVYHLPIYREHETLYLTIAKGLDLSPDVDLSDEGKAYVQERAGKWCVTGVGVTEEPRDPSTDYMGKMENYLELKGIHSAKVYFVSSINPSSMMNAVCFTGNKTPAGEDEIIFVAVDRLTYDELGNLVVTKRGDDEFYDISEAEYTYDELCELNKKQILKPGQSGGVGGVLIDKTGLWICIAMIAGAIVISAIVVIIYNKRKQRKF